MQLNKVSTSGIFLLLLAIWFAAPLHAQDWQEVEEIYIEEYREEEETTTQQQLKEQMLKEYQQQPVNGNGIDKDVWQQVTQGADYTENVIKQEPQQQEVQNREAKEGFSLNQTWIRVLLITLILGVLAFLILKLFGVNVNLFRRKKKFTDAIDIERLEDELPKTELEKYLDSALKQENYRLALRILYLMVIKQLWHVRLIKWARNKTNRDYLREMRQHSSFSTFNKLTAIFERIWYGNNHVTQQDYKRISPYFQQFLGRLKQDSE